MLSLRMGVPIQQLQASITSNEFLDYQEVLLRELNRNTKRDYALAQIACEIHRGNSRHPGKVTVADFLIKMVPKEDEGDEDLSIERRTQMSKAFWGALVGIRIE